MDNSRGWVGGFRNGVHMKILPYSSSDDPAISNSYLLKLGPNTWSTQRFIPNSSFVFVDIKKVAFESVEITNTFRLPNPWCMDR